jgi:site-specific DNA recombinase
MYQMLVNMDVAFYSVSEKYETSTLMGRTMMNIATVFAQLERETTAERIRDSMRELAKSGRWLGGMTPTGYKSTEIVGSITVDGKARKAFKLDIIKDEASIIIEIFNKYLETMSLSQTDTYFLKKGTKTKNGVSYTRSSIRAILTNPVYMIADKEAYDYFQRAEVDIYADKSAFDSKHGIMAYNKTRQSTEKSYDIRDMSEWIIAVGKHEGIIPGVDWVKVQNHLIQNKSKAYRKPKSHVALLSGLLRCADCGDFMRPKKNSRKNKAGEYTYSYLCETKEKSKSELCNISRPNGNTLDKMVVEEVKKLSDDSSDFIKKLDSTSRTVRNTTEEYKTTLVSLKNSLAENERQISELVKSLAKSEGSSIYEYISNEVDTLHGQNKSLIQEIDEWEGITRNHALSDMEFELLKNLVKSFGESFETMTMEQKRTALRVFVKKITWDGTNAHIYLLGSDDDNPHGRDPIDFDDIPPNNDGGNDDNPHDDSVLDNPDEVGGEAKLEGLLMLP